MKKIYWLSLTFLLTTACTMSRNTTEYDPVSSQAATYWTGLFFTALICGVSLVLVVWIIAYYFVERAKEKTESLRLANESAETELKVKQWQAEQDKKQSIK